MRAVVELPDDLHRIAQAIADDAGITLSEAIVRLLRSAVPGGGPVRVTRSPTTGLPVASIGRPVTSEDVHACDAEDW